MRILFYSVVLFFTGCTETSVNTQQGSDRSKALRKATSLGDTDKVVALINADKNGNTALIWVVLKSHTEIARTLVNTGTSRYRVW